MGKVHILQTNLLPPKPKLMKGLIYVLHLRQRGGPGSPKSRTGMGCSPGWVMGARGWRTRPRGRAVAARASAVEGMLLRVRRAYLGEELPWSWARKGTAPGGGTCWSMVW